MTGVIKTETITHNPLFTLATSKVTQTHTSQGPSFNPSRNTTNTTGKIVVCNGVTNIYNHSKSNECQIQVKCIYFVCSFSCLNIYIFVISFNFLNFEI